MTWEAANAPKARRERKLDDSSSATPGQKRRATETVEAALSRLGKAYTTSMECVGALNKTNHVLQKQATVTDDAFAVLQRVSNAARSTLEGAILLDPLILAHVPTTNDVMHDFASTQNASERWTKFHEKRPIPPLLSSAAHKSTVRQLAYLSLVNYADLLLSGCTCGGSCHATSTVLDRGVVKTLKLLEDRKHCCWNGESRQDTLRLALTALCDASNLDGSDPTLWLKLACSARQLERILARDDPSVILQSKYRRLQRYALERGSLALPPTMPPNRTIVRALKELQEPLPLEYPALVATVSSPVKLVLELPRYSWSMLGRLLVRACREGSDYAPSDSLKLQPSTTTIINRWTSPSLQFGSPCIVLKLSPMLVLPSRVLGRICQFLENSAIWKFEATCRALSVSIIAARASMEQETGKIEEKKEAEESKDNENMDKEGETADEKDSGVPRHDAQRETSGEEKRDGPSRTHRTSKRVLSQLITSGKIADRKSRRNSVEFCFLAATLSCTKEEHRDNIKKLMKEDKTIARLLEGGELSLNPNIRGSSLLSDATNKHRNEARERICDSSLSMFAERWSCRNSGPMDLLMRYLGHVATNVEDVFSSDPGGSMVLTSCVLGCFELYMRRSGFLHELAPRFFKPVSSTGSIKQSKELFAIDILHGELILRQCDRYSPSSVEFDDDSNLISLMVPNLICALEELDEQVQKAGESKIDTEARVQWGILKIRCNWLAAGYYLWRSRISRIVTESREAEEEGIRFIVETAECFKSPDLRSLRTLQTSHLVSPGRSETHWKEISPDSLSKFRDEIQASSVVSLASQKFQELVSEIDRRKSVTQQEAKTSEGVGVLEDSQEVDVSEDDANALAAIGETLFERYKSPHGDPEAKHTELVDDFLTLHGDELLPIVNKEGGDTDFQKDAWTKLRRLVPAGPVKMMDLLGMSNPSILSILITGLNMNALNKLHVAELLARLVLTTQDYQNELLQQMTNTKEMKRQQAGQSEDSDSDDDSFASDDASMDRNAANKNVDEKRARQSGYFVKFLIERLATTFSDHMTEPEKAQFIASSDCHCVIQSSLSFVTYWFQKSARRIAAPDDFVDHEVFQAVRALVRSLGAASPGSNHAIKRLFFCGMVRIVIAHRHILESLVHAQAERTGRSARQKLCRKRAEFIGVVTSELGDMMSHNLSIIDSPRMVRSELLSSAESKDQAEGSEPSTGLSGAQFTLFCDGLLWLWKFASQVDVEGQVAAQQSANICSAFDRPIIKELRVPVATAIVGLCGFVTSTRDQLSKSGGEGKENTEEYDSLCLTEFFDSDTSANDWLSEDEESESGANKRLRELLRAICHAIHCIDIVYRSIDDKGAMSLFADKGFGYEYGPLLPLVTSRVLNFFADTLLLEFEPEEPKMKKRQRLWEEEYPFSTRTTGHLLDSILHKVYRWLYGFAIVGEHSAGKDLGTSVCATSELTTENFIPESTSAAAQLYRCIIRAYAAGRRSPPKAALEIVSSALPPMEESARSKALRNFMFTTTASYFELEDVTSLVTKKSSWNTPFVSIHPELELSDEEDTGDSEADKASFVEEEIMMVRKGICSQLAQGSLPVAAAEQTKNKSDAATDEERAVSSRNEEEMSKKFTFILDDLCLGEVRNCEGWYRAAQCLTMKADLIADRLGLSKGFARNANFTVPEQRPPSRPGLSLADLEAEQDRESQLRSHGWISYLGHDLTLFVRYSWASFSSLRACSEAVRESEYTHMSEADGDDHDRAFGVQVCKDIEALYQKGDFVGWQQAWGGLFVSALRMLSMRFLCMALYILQCNTTVDPTDSVLMSEICESLGISLYSDLMASQSYGYPMHEITGKHKRDLATAAKTCFQCSADTVDKPLDKDDSSEGRATWDLLFMIGKCYEKLAGTYQREVFSPPDPSQIRMYERQMALAFETYSTALDQAKTIESEGGFIVEQAGGSAHGATEVFYRVHASRLKCLISAVSRQETETERAELEALRLVERHWFKKPPEDQKTEELHIRDRVWNVLADIVSALAHCRLDQQYFHRSVYRHAQALMWAPVLNDPVAGRADGSLGTIAATRSYHIRGLNNSTHAANSAEVVMSSLFDKKRAQLCAVWVTTTSASSPFQYLNTSLRKFDSLRGKYIFAYVECLRLCRRRAELENFLKGAFTIRRDSPSYFQASASAQGGPPEKSHAHDCLLAKGRSLTSLGFLVSAKRQANNSLADVILHEISEKSKTSAENQLKHAYACFLRLHCTAEDLKRSRSFRYGHSAIHEVDAVCQAYFALGEGKQIHSNLPDWSGGGQKSAIFEAALEKCRSLFPTLTGGFFSKKETSKSKKGEDVDSADPNAPGTGKRKSTDYIVGQTMSVSFEVAVPNNLAAGSTFLTTVKYGNQQTKKVKLTVPKGQPKTLRFTLKVPKETDVGKTKKARPNEE